MDEIVIPRELYIDKVRKVLGKQMIVVLTGQRRVGKSYVLKSLKYLAEGKYKIEGEPITGEVNIVPENHDTDRGMLCERGIGREKCEDNNVIYIDKEKREFDHINDYKDLNNYIADHFDSDRYNLILIDEVQDIEEFEKSLRSWRTEPNTDIVVTGSNAHILNTQLSTLIGGRYKEIYVQSLSYTEFLIFHNLQDSDESLSKYIEYGGLPGLIKFGLNSDARQYQNDVLDTALMKDVILRNNIRNVNFLYNLITYMADNIGKPFSPFSISKYMKSRGESVSPTLIGNYMKYFEEAYIISNVDRYDIHGKTIFDTNGKNYFEDLGIRNALVGGTRQRDIEKLLENIVYQQLVRMGYDVKIGQLNAGEVDFVCSKPGETGSIYIQVTYIIASDKTYEREFGVLKRINDNYPKYVISMSPLVDSQDEEGITHLHLRRFLTGL